VGPQRDRCIGDVAAPAKVADAQECLSDIKGFVGGCGPTGEVVATHAARNGRAPHCTKAAFKKTENDANKR
jgi:hypothetical protein